MLGGTVPSTAGNIPSVAELCGTRDALKSTPSGGKGMAPC